MGLEILPYSLIKSVCEISFKKLLHGWKSIDLLFLEKRVAERR